MGVRYKNTGQTTVAVVGRCLEESELISTGGRWFVLCNPGDSRDGRENGIADTQKSSEGRIYALFLSGTPYEKKVPWGMEGFV